MPATHGTALFTYTKVSFLEHAVRLINRYVKLIVLNCIYLLCLFDFVFVQQIMLLDSQRISVTRAFKVMDVT